MEERESFVTGADSGVKSKVRRFSVRPENTDTTCGHQQMLTGGGGGLVCTCAWLRLFLLPLFWLLLFLLLLFGEAAQRGLTISWGGHELGQLARLSGILGFQVIFKQRLGE